MNKLFLTITFVFQTIGLQLLAQTPEWENPQIVQVNELKPHSAFYHYPNMLTASKIDKSGLSWMLSLKGNWQFNYVLKTSDRPQEFTLPSFDGGKWEITRIPFVKKNDKLVTRATFPDVPHDGNPVNSYRRIFPVPENWYAQQIILCFNGAGSGFYVWLNGKRIGYSETGNCGSEFNVTPYINFGRTNTLAVQTYTLTDDTWFNANDSVPNTGIYGDVYIYTVPNLCIFDFKSEANIVSGSGQLKVSVIPKQYLQSISGKFKLIVTLKDKDGKDLIAPVQETFKASKKADSVVVFNQHIAQIKAWNPGDPNLYSLFIELKDKDDQTIEVVGTKIGFRSVSFKDSLVIVNGISTNISSIMQLPVISSNGQLIKIISQLKENKNYFVCTGNAAIDHNMLSLFDINGICVIENIPFEIDEKNVSILGNEIRWKDHIFDRVKKISARDKNHPSVIGFKIDENLKGNNFNAARKLIE